ncbi:MAG TPA: hypothetical protein PLC42_03465 [Parachlamydiaceae bacterium]|nr:hypothetical protein [Parachlamydiaceae bacterium]
MIPEWIGQAGNALNETGRALLKETGKFLYQTTLGTSKRIYDDWDLMTGCQLAKMVFKSAGIASVAALAVKKQPFVAKLAEYPGFAFLFTGVAVFSHLTDEYLENRDALNFSEAAREQNDLLDRYPLLEKVLTRINT